MRVTSTGCCAVRELRDISSLPTSEAVICQAVNGLAEYMTKPPFIMFTGVIGERRTSDHATMEGGRRDDYSTDLATYITDHGLGIIIDTIPPQTGLTGNLVKVWMWLPNYDALRQFTANRKEEEQMQAAQPERVARDRLHATEAPF